VCVVLDEDYFGSLVHGQLRVAAMRCSLGGRAVGGMN